MINLQGNKYVVTGGSGFIGSHLCEEIVRQEKLLICIDNFISGKKENLESWWNPNRCTLLHADIGNLSDAKAIEKACKGADAIFHCAASKCTMCLDNPLMDLQTNAWGSFMIFSIACELGIKVIHSSTGSVNDNNPVSFYGVTKLTAEKYLPVIKNYYPDFQYTILRYYHIFGPRQDNSDKGGVIPIFIRNVKQGNPIVIYGDGNQVRHFTWVKDVVRANLWAVKNGLHKTYDVVSNTKMSINTLARIIKMKMGKPHYPVVHENEKVGDIKSFTCGNADIISDGFEGFETPFDILIEDTIRSYS